LSSYLLKRGATYLLVLAVALSLNFFLPRLIPGNPIEEASSGSGALPVRLDAQTLELLKSYYGLDRPMAEQFLRYLAGLAQGNLGYSISYRAPVASLLLERLPWTLLLVLVGLVTAFCAALPLGLRAGLSGKKEWRVLAPAILLESVPPFFLGSFLLILFAVKLPIFPLSGAYSTFGELTGAGKIVDFARHGFLPVLVFAASSFFSAYLIVRGSVRLVQNEPYVLMAEMKGVPERAIRYGYVLRNALLPVVTFFGTRLATGSGRAVLVEVLFAYPGIGRLSYEAVLGHDYPLLQGTFLAFTLWILVINFCTDWLYASFDPRVEEI
jgi:peptide/nickel transport system permease protein